MGFELDILKKKYLADGEESWEDLCNRFPEFIRPLMLDKKYSPAGSVLANWGQGLSYSNCFTRDTRFITDRGIKSFYDFEDGDTCRVLTSFGNYENAVVSNHGVQPIWEITFRRGSEKVKVRCTPDHLWPTIDGLKETKDLIGGGTNGQEPHDKLLHCNTDGTEGYWHVEEVITLLATDTVWCLNVENKHTFVLERGIPTHNCYQIPIEGDSIEDIFDFMKHAARTFSYRGGVGTDISVLRYKGAPVNNAAKFSSGSVSFLPLISTMILSIGQGSDEEGNIVARRGAGIALEDISHPDIENFIRCKSEPDAVFGVDIFKSIPNDVSGLNLSVKITDKFMHALENGEEWELVWNGKVVRTIDSEYLWNLIAEKAWASGDPGVVFFDNARHGSTTDFCEIGKVKGTNPCQPGNATVLTPSGISIIGAIKEGDLIWGKHGWTRVIRKEPRGFKPVYEYFTSVGCVECTQDHKIFQRGERIEARNAEAIDICTIDQDFDLNILDPQGIMDGIVMGRGKLDEDNNIIIESKYFNVDWLPNQLRSFIKEAREDGSVVVRTKTDPVLLMHSGLKCIPKMYFNGPPVEAASFLQGLFAAIGKVKLNKSGTVNRYIIRHFSSRLIYQVQELLSSLGITSRVSREVRKNGNRSLLEISNRTAKMRFKERIGFLREEHDIGEDNKSTWSKTTFEITRSRLSGLKAVFDITVDNPEHCYWSGGHLVSNCGEIWMPEWGNCNLSSFNLIAFVNDKGEFMWDEFKEAIPYAVRFADLVIDENTHPLQKQTEKDLYLRKIGIGITGLGDALAKMGLKYSSEEGRKFAKKVMRTLTVGGFKASVELAKEKGPAPALEKVEDRKKFIEQPFVKRFPEALKEDIVKYGCRNTAMTSIAPTGSLSIILGNVTSGCEPLFDYEYVRKSRTTGETHKIIHPPAVEHNIPAENYERAPDIAWKDRLAMQAALQSWTTDSISSTVNLPAETTVEEIKHLYKFAWKLGLKGVTIYRDGSKDIQVLSSSDDKCEKRPKDIVYSCAPKRPKDLECSIHRATIKGEKYIVLVGLFNGKPYEVFCGKADILYIPTTVDKGVIRKNGNGRYSLIINIRRVETVYKDIAKSLMNDKERALTRMISLSMRHGAYLKFIVEQLRKTEGSIVDFSSVVARILSKYAKELDTNTQTCPECGMSDTLTFVEGCLKCTCGWSKCG